MHRNLGQAGCTDPSGKQSHLHLLHGIPSPADEGWRWERIGRAPSRVSVGLWAHQGKPSVAKKKTQVERRGKTTTRAPGRKQGAVAGIVNNPKVSRGNSSFDSHNPILGGHE